MEIKKYICSILIFITLIILVGAVTPSFAAENETITADNSTGIAGGISVTDNGGTLTLEQGKYDKITDRGNTISKNITIIGKNATIDAKESGRIFTISGSYNTITFKGITFINGKTTNSNGGAIYNPTTTNTLLFVDCIFINNHVTYTSSYYYGGAIYTSGKLSVDNSEFYNNSATWGGAISVSNGFNINNSKFINNTAQEALTNVASGGAAVYIVSNNVVYNSTIDNCYFENNIINASSQYGAAICDASSYGTNITIINSKFVNNSGRTIIHTNNDNIYIGNCYFEKNKGNSVIRLGQVVGNKYNNTVANCIFINNSVASSGQDSGCIAADDVIGLNIYNNTFISNNLAMYLVGCSGNIYNNSINGSSGISQIGNTNKPLLNITSNTIITTANGIYIASYNSHNVSINHNRIISNSYAIYSDKSTTADINADYNWFGQNKPNVYNINLNYWYVANVVNITAMQKSIVYFTYTMELNNGDTSLAHLLPLFNGEAYNNGVLTYTYIAKEAKNMKFVNELGTIPVYYFTVDNEIFKFSEEVIAKIDTNTTINIPENIKKGDTITITGKVTDENDDVVGNIVINVEIDGNIFTINVDENGNWNLDYNVNRSGNFNIIVTWKGDNIYNEFINNDIFSANINSLTDDDVSEKTQAKKINKGINQNQISNGEEDTRDNEQDSSIDDKSTSNKQTKDIQAKSSMKETGMPIVAILLVLISIIGIGFRKRQN